MAHDRVAKVSRDGGSWDAFYLIGAQQAPLCGITEYANCQVVGVLSTNFRGLPGFAFGRTLSRAYSILFTFMPHRDPRGCLSFRIEKPALDLGGDGPPFFLIFDDLILYLLWRFIGVV